MVKGFKTVDIMGVVGGLLLVVFVIIGSFHGLFVDKNVKKAQVEAESLGNQIIAGGLKNLQTESLNSQRGRAIASINKEKDLEISEMTRWGVMRLEGTIGKDPWGEKFNYKIVPIKDKNEVVFVVWSNGPNRKKETDNNSKDFFGKVTKKTGRVTLIGDDIGSLQVIPL